MDYLNRGQSPLPDAIWREIAKAAAEAARDRLTGRRFLELQGPSTRASPRSKPGTTIIAASRRSIGRRLALFLGRRRSGDGSFFGFYSSGLGPAAAGGGGKPAVAI